MNTKSLLICVALLVAFSVATAQRNEDMFSPAGCKPNSRPVDCAPRNQRSCSDNQENQVDGNEGEADCEGEGCICFEGYVWNEERTRCVEPSECDQE